jgi:arginyl-tRNA--protein-N-Asp/Glu arginylyltransferase
MIRLARTVLLGQAMALEVRAGMDQKKNFPEFYITAPQPCPYLPGRKERKLFTHLTQDKPAILVDSLLKGGFRRSQNIAYMPYCEECSACVSVRVLADEFKPDKSMQRVTRRNGDVVAFRNGARPTSEQYSLFRGYIDARHSDGGMADMSVLDYAMMVEDSVIDTQITEYRLRPDNGSVVPPDKWPLIGEALCDYLGDGISMVYSFFEPDYEDRSLGTLMILETLEQAKRLGLAYVYLGYWIEGSRKMSYKARFRPQERLSSRGWEHWRG